MEKFTDLELKCILKHIQKNQPEGRFKNDLCVKIVKMRIELEKEKSIEKKLFSRSDP